MALALIIRVMPTVKFPVMSIDDMYTEAIMICDRKSKFHDFVKLPAVVSEASDFSFSIII